MEKEKTYTVHVECVKPYKTLPKGQYKAQCVRKEGSDGSYNGAYTTQWENCQWSECTSLAIVNEYGVVRRYSRKNFKLIF